MPGPKHGTPRKAGARPDPEGNPRKANRKAAARLEARQKEVPTTGYYPIGLKTGFFRKPGSQNRSK